MCSEQARRTSFLARRGEWTGPWLVALRWLLTWVFLVAAPVMLFLLGPWGGIVGGAGMIVVWLWWTAPAVGINMNPLAKLLILIGLGIHLGVVAVGIAIVIR